MTKTTRRVIGAAVVLVALAAVAAGGVLVAARFGGSSGVVTTAAASAVVEVTPPTFPTVYNGVDQAALHQCFGDTTPQPPATGATMNIAGGPSCATSVPGLAACMVARKVCNYELWLEQQRWLRTPVPGVTVRGQLTREQAIGIARQIGAASAPAGNPPVDDSRARTYSALMPYGDLDADARAGLGPSRAL